MNGTLVLIEPDGKMITWIYFDLRDILKEMADLKSKKKGKHNGEI